MGDPRSAATPTPPTGSTTRCSGLMGLLLGSAAVRLLDWLPCDTLGVRGAG